MTMKTIDDFLKEVQPSAEWSLEEFLDTLEEDNNPNYEYDMGYKPRPVPHRRTTKRDSPEYSECLDCDALIRMHRAGYTHCTRCDEEWGNGHVCDDIKYKMPRHAKKKPAQRDEYDVHEYEPPIPPVKMPSLFKWITDLFSPSTLKNPPR